MKIERIDPAFFKKSLKGALEYFELNYRTIDNLNVFPVPDGDTGINMLFTFKPAVDKVLSNGFDTISEIGEILRSQSTSNSRGNSGFILARFFYGFSEVIDRQEFITVRVLAEAFSSGMFTAKTSLSNPVEGTMITIMNVISETMNDIDTDDVIECLKAGIDAARKAVFNTPKQLPMLAKAGVVDSGALGFVFILEGMLRGLTGDEMIREKEDDYRFEPDPTVDVNISDELKYQYCTELIVENPDNRPLNGFREFLEGIGDSIAVMNSDGIVKLHVHTNEPDRVLDEAQAFGKLIKKKIEDMFEQVAKVSVIKHVDDPVAVLVMAPGDGFVEVFRELGATWFIEYSDHLPASGEIIEKFKEIDSNNIIVLSNDKNIVPAIELAISHTEKHVHIIQTKNVVQGITAMYGYSESETLPDNAESMSDCLDMAMTVFLYRSVRDTQFGETQILEGNYFVTDGPEILTVGENFSDVLLEALKGFDMSDKGSVTVYYRNQMEKEDADKIESAVKEMNSMIEFEVVYGGQKKAELIIAIE